MSGSIGPDPAPSVRVILDWRDFGVGGHGPYLRVYGSDESLRGWDLRVPRSDVQDHAVYEGPWPGDFMPRPLIDADGRPVLTARASEASVLVDAHALARRLGVELEIMGSYPTKKPGDPA